MRAQKCKGTRDLMPGEMNRFRLIEGVFRDRCIKWGYEEVRTPVIEYLYLFTSAGTLTPGRLRKVYSFLDWDGWSGERVVLRPDVTIPIARLYIETMADKELARLFYVSNVFSFEGTGREAREKWQCGAEIIGAGSMAADVELIALALEVLKKLGLKGGVAKLSHAGLIRALLAEFGLDHEKQTQVFDHVLDGDMELLAQLRPERPELGTTLAALLDLKGKSSGFLKNLRALVERDLPGLKVPFDSFINLVDCLESIGCNYQVDITSGRGFEYYTGLMFQLFADEIQVGGGGRYDALIPLLGGTDTPASGFALDIDHLMNLLDTDAIADSSAKRILVKTSLKEAGAFKRVADMAACLRDAGYPAEIHLGGKEPDDIKWLLEVRARAPRYTLISRTTRQRCEAETESEVLAFLNKSKRGQ
ncbi:MAG: histidine--tRNA ligase family protein [Chloroflexi bacterium]|nr:histidine--tRNA ligase family protein [Chloroflexota bacterium]